MCFSPGASFTLGAALLVTGAASLKEVKRPRQVLLAGIPVLFGIQQIIEGFMWLSLTHPGWEAWRWPVSTRSSCSPR
jgi:hypothetical protein